MLLINSAELKERRDQLVLLINSAELEGKEGSAGVTHCKNPMSPLKGENLEPLKETLAHDF